MKRTIKKYLVPHEGNDHRPYLLREKGALGLIIVILAVFIVVATQAYIIRIKTPAAVVSSVLVDLANADRSTRGLKQLTMNPVLVQAAQLKANDMAAKGYFSHTSPDNLSPWHWFNEVSYSFMYAGENLAVNFTESNDVETAWMNSEGHRSNILNDKFTEIGIATANGIYNGQQTVFVVQMFGTPMPAKYVARNQAPAKPKPAIAAKPITKPATTTPKSGEQSVRVTAVKDMFIAVENASITPAVEQTESVAPAAPKQYSSFIDRMILRPKYVLAIVYGIITALIFTALVLILRAELKRHHAKMALYGFALIIAMAALAYAYGAFVVTQVIVV